MFVKLLFLIVAGDKGEELTRDDAAKALMAREVRFRWDPVVVETAPGPLLGSAGGVPGGVCDVVPEETHQTEETWEKQVG